MAIAQPEDGHRLSPLLGERVRERENVKTNEYRDEEAQAGVEETRAPLSARRARQIRSHRHERLAWRGDRCGFEVVIHHRCP